MSNKHPGGRPRQGVTKKVSLTLTVDEWEEIEESGLTVAAFIKSKMHPPVIDSNQMPDSPISAAYSKDDFHQLFKTVVKYDLKDKGYSSEIISKVKESMLNIMFPIGSEAAVLVTKTQYVCPFFGKRFGSVQKIIESAIPRLLEGEINGLKLQEKMKDVNESKDALAKSKYFDQMF